MEIPPICSHAQQLSTPCRSGGFGYDHSIWGSMLVPVVADLDPTRSGKPTALPCNLRAEALIKSQLPPDCAVDNSNQSPHKMDSDLYPHRGFMLDTGRKFFPVQAILSLLTVLHQYNFNIFHWHIYDAESFPLQLPADPGLTNVSMAHSHTSDYYTHRDIQNVISHAQNLGILVYPETDMPGHCDIWSVTRQC